MSAPRTLYDKIWDDHVVNRDPDGTCLLYIDRHLVHEVTSPQAFEGLRIAGRPVHSPTRTLAVVDHNVPTTADRLEGIKNEESRIQVDALDVPRDMLARIHQGEKIVPAAQNTGASAGSGQTLNIVVNVNGNASAPDVRRAAGQGAREAIAAFSNAGRYR